ncbi:site-specific DNA-methyltransferase [Candidatus Peregrinibacteria bacterium CG10_big_fil_rev_8_21_14_0_10_55_24]|nr:MAG: site-specific DNA-methyltransferase [Candidatus Peregrinibacteria bacterium CG10_big_fil_rev_8_21_14_0_10_55_24]
MPTLRWIGKEAVVNHHHTVPFHLLKDVQELSVGDPGSGNLIVEGDNLLALKALLPYYAGQVKCIYIDPPYNTGNEGWAYNDNVNSPVMKEWLGQVVGKEGETLDRHDRWLCMMYPRLALLRKFLREDGAIFVSIDDNEVQNLRAIMDDIYGKKNFVAQFVWNTEGHTDNQFHIKVNHEYLVMYATKETTLKLGFVVDPNTREGSNLWAGYAENSITKNGPGNPASEITLPIGFPTETEELQLPETNVPAGLIEAMNEKRHTSNQLKAQFGRVQFPLRFDSMEARNKHLINKCRVYSGWANANKLRNFIDAGCVPIADDDGMQIRFFISSKGVIYYRKDRGDQARNILSVLRNLGTTEKMRAELESMGIKFQYPKPKELLRHIVRVGSDEGDLVMDSFAGSGTTAHAAIELNSSSKIQRRFILIQMPWENDEQRTKDKNLTRDITAERIKRVAQGYTNLKGEVVAGLGGGFRYCRLSEPLFDEKGKIRESVKFAELARHVYFTETGEPLPKERVPNTPLIGIHHGVGVYLLYNGILKDKTTNGGNVLTSKVLVELPEHEGPKVVYGTACRLGAARLRREGIVFKQLPYRLRIDAP